MDGWYANDPKQDKCKQCKVRWVNGLRKKRCRICRAFRKVAK